MPAQPVVEYPKRMTPTNRQRLRQGPKRVPQYDGGLRIDAGMQPKEGD